MSQDIITAVDTVRIKHKPKSRHSFKSLFKSSSRTTTSTERPPLYTSDDSQDELSPMPVLPPPSTSVALELLRAPGELQPTGPSQSNSHSGRRRRPRKKKEEEQNFEMSGIEILNDPAQFGLFTLHEPADESLTVKAFPVDIIALHGIDGTPYKTWTHTTESPQTGEKRDVFWLKDFLPQEFPGCRIYTYGYNAKILFSRGTGNIDSFARSLLESIADKRLKREEKRRPIIFVAHSMGGLVVKRALTIATLDMKRFGNIKTSTAAIFFLATPHRGSKNASVAKYVAAVASGTLSTTGVTRIVGKIRNDLIQGLRRDDPVVTTIANDFAPMTDGQIRFYSFLEDLTTPPLNTRVVDEIAGRMNIAAEVVIHMAGEDHRSIARFSSSRSTSYLSVLSKLKEAVNAATNTATRATTSEDVQCLRSLAFSSMTHRRIEADKSHPRTCAWLLTHPFFTTWLNAPSVAPSETSPTKSILWIKGHPGTGKSTLMAFVYRHLLAQNTASTIRLYFFFTGRGEALEKSPLGLYRSLLHQIYMQTSIARKLIYTVYEEKTKELKDGEEFSWQEDELRDLLMNVVKEVAKKREITFFVDALDEAVSSDSSKAATSLADYFSKLDNIVVPEEGTVGGMRMIISCRNYPVVGGLGPGLEIRMEEENSHDLRRFVGDTLRSGVEGWESEDENMRKVVVDALCKKAAGVFQWAVLRVPKIVKSLNDGEFMLDEVKGFVNAESNELFSLYTSILRNDIARPARGKASLFFQWIALASRPLTLPELRFAIACDAHYSEFVQDCCEGNGFVKTDSQMQKLTKSLSGGLAVVLWSKGVSRIQFVHETVNDFLRAEGLGLMSNLNWPSQDIGNIVGESEDRLARSCINYLRLEHVLEVARRWERFTEAMPVFLDYAVKGWYLHAEKAERSGVSQKGLGEVLSSDAELWQVLMSATSKLLPVHWKALLSHSRECLHVATARNLQTVVKFLLDSGTEVDQLDEGGNTALHYAAQTGREALVTILLGLGANVDAKNNSGMNPLELAASNGHGVIVETLLAQGTSGDWCEHGDTLQAAVKKDSLPLVKVLLENGGNPSLPSRHGNLPIVAAALDGDNALIKLLVSYGADINAQDKDWGTALQAASFCGSKHTVQLLLTLGADVNSPGSAGVGPALHAAMYGGQGPSHVAVVQLLLESGARVNEHGGVYGSALQAACAFSSSEGVQLLLDNEADIDAQGGFLGTALIAAITSGSIRKIQMIINKGARLDVVGGEFGNALQAAASKDNKDLVEFLLSRGTDVNIQGGKYGSALQAALVSGPSCADILLSKGARVNTPGEEYGTPLYAAVFLERVEFVRRLLESGADPNFIDYKDCSLTVQVYPTVLQRAAMRGSLPIIKLLLEYGADVNATHEKDFGTALQVAVFYNKREIAERLLDHGADVEESVGYYGRPLYLAIRKGNRSMIELLLAKGAKRNFGCSVEQMISRYREERKAPAHY